MGDHSTNAHAHPVLARKQPTAKVQCLPAWTVCTCDQVYMVTANCHFSACTLRNPLRLPSLQEFFFISCCACRSLVLRKIKSSNSKLAFGTLLHDPTHPDWRFKLLAQYNFKAVSFSWLRSATQCSQLLAQPLTSSKASGGATLGHVSACGVTSTHLSQ